MDKLNLRAAKLKSELEEHRYRYYVLEAPIISDGAYDSLVRELEGLETAHPELWDPNSPTQRVGAEPLSSFKKHTHMTPMLSLNDAFSDDGLERWYSRITKSLGSEPELHCDVKMDGLAVALTYEDGWLALAATRGNGTVGEDVTSSVRTIGSIPLKLRSSDDPSAISRRVEVRGEIIIYKTDFAALNASREETHQPLFANPRNLAAGSIRQLDPKLAAARPLRFHAYRVLMEETLPTLQAEYELASRLGFIVNRNHQTVGGKAAALAFIQEIENKRHDLPFQTDGVVLFVNRHQQFDALGVVGKAPRGAIAYKYPAEQTTTQIRDIQLNVGRTGAVTPFAVLQPVLIAGSTVGLATLHNAGEIERKDIRSGDHVIVQKAGDIIPEVVESLPGLRDGSEKVFKMPSKCPICETVLVKPGAEKVWRCPNPSCPSRIHRQIEHFASKAAFDIDGLGEQIVRTLLDKGLIKDAADLFTLDEKLLLGLEGFKEKSAANLLNAIHNARHPSLDRFIFGLGIRHVGTQTAIDLGQNFRSLDAIRDASVETLAEVDGIGTVVAAAIAAWFADPLNQQLLDKLASSGVTPKKLIVKNSGELAGQTFVITGTLDSMSRDEAADKIRALGGKVSASVSAKTDFVVVGENPGSNKVEQAQSRSTKQLSEQQFVDLIT